MNVKAVILAVNEQAMIHFPTREFDWEAPGPSISEALDQTFREFNAVTELDNHAGRKCRSMSVGDLIIAGGKTFVVEPIGFSEMSEEAVAEWVTFPYRRRLMGRSDDWLPDHDVRRTYVATIQPLRAGFARRSS
jgi:hypothetical protein